MDLYIVVRGNLFRVRVDRWDSIRKVTETAIATSNEDPDANWDDVRHDGRALDPLNSVRSEGLREGDRLFLSWRAGAAA